MDDKPLNAPPPIQPPPQTPQLAPEQPLPPSTGGPPPPPISPPTDGPTNEEPILEEEPKTHPPFTSTLIKILVGIVTLALIIFLGTRVFVFVKNRISPPPPQTTTLTYWGLWEDKNIMDPVIKEFEKNHPNIKIDYQKRDIKQYRETLSARLASPQTGAPDIFRIHNSWLPVFEKDLAPLPKSVIGENPKDDFYPTINRDLVKNGAYYALPLEIDTLVLFVNNQILKGSGSSPPRNWNDVKALAPKLTIKDQDGKIRTAGIALGTFDNISHAPDIISLTFAQNGVDPQNIKDGETNAQDALLFYTSFAKGEGKVWDETQDSSVLAFAKGNLVMFLGYSWDALTLTALSPSLDFDVLPVPQLSEDNPITIASYWAEGVSKKSKNQKAAFEFLSFLAKQETVQKLYSQQSKTRMFGEPPARLSLSESVKDVKIVSTVLSQAKVAVSTPFSSDTFDNGLNSELNKYLGDAVRAILSNTSADSAVTTLLQGVDSVSLKYGIR